MVAPLEQGSPASFRLVLEVIKTPFNFGACQCPPETEGPSWYSAALLQDSLPFLQGSKPAPPSPAGPLDVYTFSTRTPGLGHLCFSFSVPPD